MFSFNGSPVPVRKDLKDSHKAIWAHLAQPGQVFDANRRRMILNSVRTNTPQVGDPVELLAATLYANPPAVTQGMVRSAIDTEGEPAAVEAISIVSMLAAVDNTHLALGVELEPLPEPIPGEPSGVVASGLRKRRTLVAMPRNSITVALDLLPLENMAYAAACGPHYMTFAEMASPLYERSPGLNRAQLETIASRTSLFQECFY